ncbi:MAG: hypothetical protein IMW92_08860, partial [Bacillales bacterium]|nr:hypothetical protein [Bacillales bacterium]
AIAFPFGAYQDKLNAIQKAAGMDLQFTIYQGVLDTRENHNEAAVDDLNQIPRIMMVNDELTSSFEEVLTLNTLEKFTPSRNTEKIDVYAYIIYRDWGCHSLRENWRDIDVGVFDAYNFDADLNISGQPNPDWQWFKNKGKKVYAMFGNYGLNDFDPAIVYNIFNNPQTSIDRIEEVIRGQGWDGIAIDFEEVPPELRDRATDWFRALSQRFRTDSDRKNIFVAAPYPFAADPSWAEWFDYVKIAKVVDMISPMTYLDHGSWTGPGPISDMTLFKRRYTELIKMGVPTYKIAGGVGVFGCVWSPEFNAEQNILEIQMKMDVKRPVEIDNDADEWHCYLENGGEAWFQAPDTFQNRIRWLKEQGISSIAIWKLDDDEFGYWDAGFGSHLYKFNNPVHRDGCD